MNPDPLDRRLAEYAKQPLPAAPGDVAANVWRAIERRHHQALAARIGWHELLARPGWAIAGLVFAVAVGAAPAFAFVKVQQAKRLAEQSLHFDVFSMRTGAQVMNVLAGPERATNPTHSP